MTYYYFSLPSTKPSIGTCLSSISVILLEIFGKDLFTLLKKTSSLLSHFTFSKSVINILKQKCLKFCL